MIKSGERIGQYLVKEVIGSGGMAVVYKAFDTVNHRLVALKFIDSSNELTDALKRFKREAAILAKLRHPNVVEVYDFFELPNGTCFSMEIIEGITLESLHHEYRKTGNRYKPMEVFRVLPILEDIAQALQEAHINHIFHRDIKPANVIIENTTNRTVLLDFGLARGGGEETLTKTGAVLGTLFYLAPEQIKSKPIGGYTDVYQWGMVAWHLLTGRLPFDDEDEVTMAVMRTANDIPPVQSVAPQVPEKLAGIIDKALSRDERDRYPDGGQLLYALTGEGTSSMNKEPPPKAHSTESPAGGSYIAVEQVVVEEGNSHSSSRQVKGTSGRFRRRVPASLVLVLLAVASCLFFYNRSEELSQKRIASPPPLKKLEPLHKKMNLRASLNGPVGMEVSVLHFQSVVPCKARLCKISPVIGGYPLRDDVRLKGILTDFEESFSCSHSLSFHSWELGKSLFIRYLTENGYTVDGPPLRVKEIIRSSFENLLEEIMPFGDSPEGYFRGAGDRFKRYEFDLSSRDKAKEQLSADISREYCILKDGFSGVSTILPWFFTSRHGQQTHWSKVASAYCILKYLPEYARREGFILENPEDFREPFLFSALLRKPIQFKNIATTILEKPMRLYHRDKFIADKSYGFGNSKDFVESQTVKITGDSLGVSLSGSHVDSQAIPVKTKLIKLVLANEVKSKLLQNDFVCLELNFLGCDEGFWPLVEINGVSLLLYVPGSSIITGGTLAHTFPASILQDTAFINIRFFSLPGMVKSESMVLRTIGFSGYSLK